MYLEQGRKIWSTFYVGNLIFSRNLCLCNDETLEATEVSFCYSKVVLNACCKLLPILKKFLVSGITLWWNSEFLKPCPTLFLCRNEQSNANKAHIRKVLSTWKEWFKTTLLLQVVCGKDEANEPRSGTDSIGDYLLVEPTNSRSGLREDSGALTWLLNLLPHIQVREKTQLFIPDCWTCCLTFRLERRLRSSDLTVEPANSHSG